MIRIWIIAIMVSVFFGAMPANAKDFHVKDYGATGDGGIRVPFIVWSAGLAASDRSGSVYNGLVSLADIAPTLVAQATGKPTAHPTDGTDLMPYLSGRQKPLTGRTWFWSNAGSGNTLKTKVDGAHEFTDGPLPKAIMQSVFVRDDQKITCWNAQGTDKVGVVYNRLPDVAGKPDPFKQVYETPPVAGVVPVEGAGREQFDAMQQLIHDSEGDLAPTWTGDSKKAAELWWFLK